MSSPAEDPWFTALLVKLLSGDRATLRLLRTNPFPDVPPRWVRAMFYEYHFAGPDERRRTGHWWARREIGAYVPPSRLHVTERRPERATTHR